MKKKKKNAEKYRKKNMIQNILFTRFTQSNLRFAIFLLRKKSKFAFVVKGIDYFVKKTYGLILVLYLSFCVQ